MPPRFAYWTILIDNAPTAFRARDSHELLPTLNQLKRTNKEVALKWFARGRLWESQEQEREDFQRRKKAAPGGDRDARERRDRDWRPGGMHKDPRARFDKNKHRRDKREQRANANRPFDPNRRPPAPTDARRRDNARPPAGYRPPPREQRSQPTGHRPLPTGPRSQPTGHRPPPTEHRSQPAGHRPLPTGHRPPPKGHRPPGGSRPPNQRGAQARPYDSRAPKPHSTGSRPPAHQRPQRPHSRPPADRRQNDSRGRDPKAASHPNAKAQPWRDRDRVRGKGAGDRPPRRDRPDERPERRPYEAPPRPDPKSDPTPEPPPAPEQIVTKPEPPERG